jgi:hypothetical protein
MRSNLHRTHPLPGQEIPVKRLAMPFAQNFSSIRKVPDIRDFLDKALQTCAKSQAGRD